MPGLNSPARELTRREAILLSAAPAVVRTRRCVAITMDDVRWQLIPEDRRADAERLLLQHLGKTSAFLFVAGQNVDNPEGSRILAEWTSAGHLLGNHTYRHQMLTSESDPAAFEQDVTRNEAILSPFPSFRKRFRFPALKEGTTRAVRDRIRGFLAGRGYQSGAVTIDASDWYYNLRLLSALQKHGNSVIQRFREPYLNHILGRARYYDQLAEAVLGRTAAHTLLIHYNLLNAMFLGDLMQAFHSNGWTVIAAEEAFQDPVFLRQPDIVPAGESLIWALAKETGRFSLRYPGEDDAYEKPILDKLGL